MKIAVCVKRVPATDAVIRISSDGKTIERGQVEHIVSTYDEIAVEEALRLKEKFGGEVLIISVGPQDTGVTIRHCFAMGADRGIHIRDTVYERDSYFVSKNLAAVLKEEAPDVILFGNRAVDDDCSQVGAMVAEMLGIPFVGLAIKVEYDGGKVTIEREVDGGHEIVEAKLPCAISVQKGLNEPRYPTLKGIMGAKKKPIEERNPVAVEEKVTVLKMEYPPSRPAGRIVGQGKEAVGALVKLLQEEAKLL